LNWGIFPVILLIPTSGDVGGVMTNRELDVMDRAAIAAFQALIIQCKGNAPDVKELSGRAWEAALAFMLDRKERRAGIWETSQGLPL
jgi:hypothetical protein